jgi:hypothetical protein
MSGFAYLIGLGSRTSLDAGLVGWKMKDFVELISHIAQWNFAIRFDPN